MKLVIIFKRLKKIYLLGFFMLFSCVHAQDQPNIIFILADDLGYGDLSCYGAKDLQTPNIDALAQQAITFTRAYANSTVCSPSRASILTGNYPNHATHCLNFDPTNQNVILSGNEGFLRKSYDKGVTWEPKTILPIYIYSIERDPDNPNHIYATGDLNGIDETIWVFRSVDNGETWSIFFEEDFPNADGAMDLQIKNGKIFLHTLTSGNFMIDIQALSVEENDYDANDFKLYPNPVNDSFSILSKNSIDKVQIYNAQGNLLLKKHLNQSSYTFDDLGLSSGIYFIRASTGNNTIYKKFIVR